MGQDLHTKFPGNFTYNNIEKKDCKNSKQRQYAIRCENWPDGWTAHGNDTWETCEGAWKGSKNFYSDSRMVRNVEWVGVEYEKEEECSNNDVIWDEPQEMCDGDGRKLKIKKCKNWVNNDPESCKNSPTKGDVKKWIRCTIGSSPGGGYHGDKATLCAPLTADASDFNCTKLLSCFAVMEDTRDYSCPTNFMTNPIGSITNSIGLIMQKLKLVGSASAIFSVILSFCCMFILLIT
jgi:hypothetical protein